MNIGSNGVKEESETKEWYLKERGLGEEEENDRTGVGEAIGLKYE